MAGSFLQTALIWAVTLTFLVTAQSLPNLRIMPLGDSITKGSGSSHGAGYRRPLREKLTGRGANVDMIGTLHNGNMVDNDHQGHSGEFLMEIKEYWKRSIDARPNVVCIHAGTNNMDKGRDLDIAPDLMEEIVDGIFSRAPDVTILLAPVIWANSDAMNRNTDAFNAKLKTMISAKQGAGKHILPVPVSIGINDLDDMKHPNDQGYNKMATAWYEAILEANKRGWLKDPVKVDPNKLPGRGLGTGSTSGNGGSSCEGGNWQKRAGIFDGVRVWDEQGTIMDGVGNGSRDKLILADLNGDGIADYVIVDNDGTIRAWINKGSPKQWTSLGKVNPKWGDILKGGKIHMADVDNDGKADLIVVYSDGAAKVWKNTDNGKKFESLDSKWATGLESGDKIRFTDIDGDGYADYVILYKAGAVKWARNTHNNGKDSSKKNWETVETVAPGVAGIPDDTARLYDLDGDGRADYVIVYDGGGVRALRNTVTSSGRNWEDLGTIAPGIAGVTGEMIRFADMDGDGHADFLAVAEDGSIRMWKNNGIIGSKGKSIKFADLDGDGKADIISVDSKGRAQAWLNQGVDSWKSIGEIAPGLDEDLSSSRIEFIDVNGDKRADYLVIYGGGSVKAYLNNGNIPDAGKGRIWQQPIVISPGVGEPGSKVQFADLNGDGYADFLIVFDGGAVDAWLNQKNVPPTDGGRIWGSRSTIATGVGQPGSKVRFADLNGDGKAEYIIQYDGGAADGYFNNGNIPENGKDRNWSKMGTIAAGVSDQGPVQYADINGDGKADYLVVHDSGKVDAYINICDWKPRGDGNIGGSDPGDGNVGGGDPGDGNIGTGTRTSTPPSTEPTKIASCEGSDCEYPWVALGDSFSAGPGAGAKYADGGGDCFRRVGSYPAQLSQKFPFEGNDMQFYSCTRAKVPGLLKQIEEITGKPRLATLSIGGNDLGFARILRACIFKPGGPWSDDCDETIARSRRIIDNDLEEKLNEAYDTLFERLGSDYRVKAFIQLYPNFFKEDTTWCNDHSMGVYPGIGYHPKVTNELRRKLNKMGDYARDKMKEFIDTYVKKQTWVENRLFYLDGKDTRVYPGHRFCEEGVTKFNDPKTWFFRAFGDDTPTVSAQDVLDEYDPDTCADDPKFEDDDTFAWYCETARGLADLNDGDRAAFLTATPETITKAFHPKTAAFSSIADWHYQYIRQLAWPPEKDHDKGKLQCKTSRDEESDMHFASRGEMEKAVEEFCDAAASGGINPGIIEGIYNDLYVSVTEVEEEGCATIDVGSDEFVDLCKSRLMNPVDECDSDFLSTQGGAFTRDCFRWYVGRQPYTRELSASADDEID